MPYTTLRYIVICCLIASTLIPLAHAQSTDESGWLATLQALSILIEERCGERFDVVWVDERGQNPPCTMSYSSACTEIQAPDSQNCSVMMKGLAE